MPTAALTLALLALPAAALSPGSCRPTGTSTLSRRAALGLGAASLLPRRPAHAAGLLDKLRSDREALSSCTAGIQAAEWNACRQNIGSLLPVLTIKGYTGESVKSVAASLGDAGQPLLDDRAALLGALGSLDKAIYLKQTGRGGAGDEAAMLSDVEKALKALDAIIAKL